VHAFICVVQNLGVAAEESNDFGTRRGERNLCGGISGEAVLGRDKERKRGGGGEIESAITYVLQLDNAPIHWLCHPS
jgi:hypothetical protein